MPLRLLFALFITLSLCPKGTAQLVWDDPTQNQFYRAMSNAIAEKDTAKMGQLFHEKVDEPGVITFQQRILFHLVFKEYDQLTAWLPTATLPDSAHYSNSFYPVMRNEVRGRKKAAWSNQFIDGIAANIIDPELRDLLTIVMMAEQLRVQLDHAEIHANYNRKVIQFIENYSYSRFRTMVGTAFNAEREQKGYSMWAGLGLGAFVQANTTPDVPTNYWEAPVTTIKTGIGFKKNFFSLWGTFGRMDEVPETINERGPFNQLFYNQAGLRYDRFLFESKRVDLLGFGGIGLGRQNFSNRSDVDDEIGVLSETFPVVSAGVRVNFNPVAWQCVVEIDEPFSYAKYSIGIESGVTRNFYSYMDNYQSMLYVSLQISMLYPSSVLRPNSALPKID